MASMLNPALTSGVSSSDIGMTDFAPGLASLPHYLLPITTGTMNSENDDPVFDDREGYGQAALKSENSQARPDIVAKMPAFGGGPEP